MNIQHSKKLEWVLRDFMTLYDIMYYDEELDKGILTLYFRLQNGICVEQKVQIRKRDYICHTTLSCYVNPDNKKSVAKYVQIANSINLELDYGHFEIDLKTGDIRFKSCYEPGDKICFESLDKLVGYPRYIINKYGNMFKKIQK